jgi:hypothetical protein
MKLDFSWQIFEKSLHIKLHENPSSGIRVVPYRRTDMMEPIVAFRSVASAPKTVNIFPGVTKITFFFQFFWISKTSGMRRCIVGRVSADVSERHNAIIFIILRPLLPKGSDKPVLRIYGKYIPFDTASHSGRRTSSVAVHIAVLFIIVIVINVISIDMYIITYNGPFIILCIVAKPFWCICLLGLLPSVTGGS